MRILRNQEVENGKEEDSTHKGDKEEKAENGIETTKNPEMEIPIMVKKIESLETDLIVISEGIVLIETKTNLVKTIILGTKGLIMAKDLSGIEMEIGEEAEAEVEAEVEAGETVTVEALEVKIVTSERDSKTMKENRGKKIRTRTVSQERASGTPKMKIKKKRLPKATTKIPATKVS